MRCLGSAGDREGVKAGAMQRNLSHEPKACARAVEGFGVMDVIQLGKLLLWLGGALLVIGAVMVFAGRLPGIGTLGRLPGDIYVKRENFSFYFPLATSLLLSVAVSLILWLLFRR